MKPGSMAYGQSDVHLRYDAGRRVSPDAARVLKRALRRFGPRRVDLVVDLGCGTGRFAAVLSETFDTPVLGVDPAANMIATAKAKTDPDKVCFVRGSADRIPLKDGSADLVFMSQVFHHLVDRAAALTEIRRVLRHEGRFVTAKPLWKTWTPISISDFFRPRANSTSSGFPRVLSW